MICHGPDGMGFDNLFRYLAPQHGARVATDVIRLGELGLFRAKQHPPDLGPGTVGSHENVRGSLGAVTEFQRNAVDGALRHLERLEGLVPANVDVRGGEPPQLLPGHAPHDGGRCLEEQLPRVSLEEGDAGGLKVGGIVGIAEDRVDPGPELTGEDLLEALKAPVDEEAHWAVVCEDGQNPVPVDLPLQRWLGEHLPRYSRLGSRS